jgi:hypothetical protein
MQHCGVNQASPSRTIAMSGDSVHESGELESRTNLESWGDALLMPAFNGGTFNRATTRGTLSR